jgi:predicted GNAT family N-acyltransferase
MVTTAQELREALSVRRAVFIEEQGIPVELEIDEHDADPAQLHPGVQSAVHVLGRRGGQPVATGRLLVDYGPGEFAHIGRIAVLPSYRGLGDGRAVMAALHEEARRRAFPGVTLAAQLPVLEFYRRLGYRARGDVFLDAGIEHRWMDLALPPAAPEGPHGR